MSALTYFVRTPSRYRRDAAIVCCLLLAITVTPLTAVFMHLNPGTAVGSEGAVRANAQNLASVNVSPAPAAVTAAAPAAPARVWPARGIVTLEFGANDMPYEAHHSGIDIAGPANQPIASFAAGTVTAAGALTSGCGKCVFVDHGSGLESHYSHLSSISVVPGQHVDAGTPLGTQGSTGWSTGPHVHFALTQNGTAVNPRNYIGGNPPR